MEKEEPFLKNLSNKIVNSASISKSTLTKNQMKIDLDHSLKIYKNQDSPLNLPRKRDRTKLTAVLLYRTGI